MSAYEVPAMATQRRPSAGSKPRPPPAAAATATGGGAATPPPSQPFFHGKISRTDAEHILTRPGMVEGTYLIRVSTSSPGDYVLSLCSAGQGLHFQIKNHGECWFSIDDGPMFEGLDAVVRYYRSRADGLPCVLGSFCKSAKAKGAPGGNTALHQACAQGNLGALRSTLNKGDINKRNGRGRTPLLEACFVGSQGCVQALLRYQPGGRGVTDVGVTDSEMNNPLHFSAMSGDDKVVEMLLRRNVQVNVRNADNETPRNIAARLGHGDACQRLGQAEGGTTPTPTEISARKQPWFHGRISRKAAEHVISLYGTAEGLFLVRESSSVAGDYVLTMSSGGQAYHFQIQKDMHQKNCFFIDDGPMFAGLERVIEYYRTTPDGLPAPLRQFCRRSSSASPRSGYTAQPLVPSGTNATPVAAHGQGAHDDEDDFDYDHFPEGPRAKAHGGRRRSSVTGTPLMINKDQLELGAELGAGEFGAVLRGVWRAPGGEKVPVAIKTLRKEAMGKGEREFLGEANVMLRLGHPHVTRLLGVCLSTPLMLVQELVPLGALLDYLPKNRRTLKTEDMIVFAQQVASGMVYLEAQSVVHRDLATRNILVATPQLVKISDFGLSRAIGADDNYYKASAGGKWPVKWYAPESVYYGKFTGKSDVWSYGVALWEIWTFGELPYEDLTGQEVLSMLDSGGRLQKPQGCPDSVFKVMYSCWEYKPDDRPSFEDLDAKLSTMLPASYQKVPIP